jgi:ubiquinone/menaquinone biosynthesis C-methylase UbiE
MQLKFLKENILLPGGKRQVQHLSEFVDSSEGNALIIGPGCEAVAIAISQYYKEVDIIVNDYTSLMLSRNNLINDQQIKVKMMDYAHTDFYKNHFDLIYAQASISVPARKEILKEIKRIIMTEGMLCVGEIVSLVDPAPAFVKDIWERSGLEPLQSASVKNYYESKGFSVISEKDLTSTLKDFYLNLRNNIMKVDKKEKEANIKFYSGIKHEADVYLRHGGDKYIGFKSFILRKAN